MKIPHMRLPACMAVVLLMAGCASVQPHAKPPAAAEPVSVQAFSYNPFLSATLPATRMQSHEEAIKALGRPLSISTRDAPSEHDPNVINSVITLRYAFGDLMYLRVSGKDVENLILIKLTGNQVPLRYGIRFGETTREKILKLFGPAQDAQENSFSYNIQYTQEITNSTTFYFRDKVLLEVDISSLMMD
jgi:hypothetical protein